MKVCSNIQYYLYITRIQVETFKIFNVKIQVLKLKHPKISIAVK